MSFQDLFKGYTQSHGQYALQGDKDQRGKAKGRAFTIRGTPTETDWERHLAGKGNGLGIIPLMDDDESVMFGVIDVDKYPLNHAALERDISERLPLTITLSKSGGAHLWLFLKEPTPAKLVISKLKEWASALGHGGVEIFPKQHKRVNKDDVGNWINLPYYGESRRCFFEGAEVSLEKFLEVAQARAVSQSLLEKIQVVQDTRKLFFDGPPCLQVLSENGGFGEGSRNNALFNVGLYYRAKFPAEEHGDKWRDMLRDFNRDNVNPPTPFAEIDGMIKTIEAKPGYKYTCNKTPISEHCKRKQCKLRLYGIANVAGNTGELGLNVELNGLTKINTTDPRWLVNIDGERCEIGGTEDLINQARFNRICINKLHKVLKKIPDDMWSEKIQELLDTVDVVDAPFDASPEGQFFQFLHDYVEMRVTDNKDAIAQGNVYVADGLAYFRFSEFAQYLRREGFRDMPNSKMFQLMHETKKFSNGRWNIKGQTVTWWSIPVEALQNERYDSAKFDDAFGDKDNEPKQHN